MAVVPVPCTAAGVEVEVLAVAAVLVAPQLQGREGGVALVAKWVTAATYRAVVVAVRLAVVEVVLRSATTLLLVGLVAVAVAVAVADKIAVNGLLCQVIVAAVAAVVAAVAAVAAKMFHPGLELAAPVGMATAARPALYILMFRQGKHCPGQSAQADWLALEALEPLSTTDRLVHPAVPALSKYT